MRDLHVHEHAVLPCITSHLFQLFRLRLSMSYACTCLRALCSQRIRARPLWMEAGIEPTTFQAPLHRRALRVLRVKHALYHHWIGKSGKVHCKRRQRRKGVKLGVRGLSAPCIPEHGVKRQNLYSQPALVTLCRSECLAEHKRRWTGHIDINKPTSCQESYSRVESIQDDTGLTKMCTRPVECRILTPPPQMASSSHMLETAGDK
jgi:hypothetical protein